MKTEIVENKKTQWLPKVGEAWTHSDNAEVYIRISDEDGRKAIGHSERPVATIFYSLCLGSGSITWTPRESNCILLEPVGGVMRFQAKEIAP